MTNQPPAQPTPPRDIVAEISSGLVRMRPTWRFWLGHVAAIAAIIIVAIGLIYLGSFVSYLWRAARFSALPAFGQNGYNVVVHHLPWWHLLFILAGALAFVFLLRRSTHIYRWPLAVTIGVFAVSFVAAAAITDATRFHDRLVNRNLRGAPVPVIGRWYHGQPSPNRGFITPGIIEEIQAKKWQMETAEGSATVKISDDTQTWPYWQPVVGAHIVVLGEREGLTIEAIEIRPADLLPDRQPFQFHPAGGERIFTPPAY